MGIQKIIKKGQTKTETTAEKYLDLKKEFDTVDFTIVLLLLKNKDFFCLSEKIS